MEKEFPIIQVALDFTELQRAIKVARDAVSAGVGCLEAGTPLIKAEGLAAVRALRKEFPKCRIVADMKVMDTGRIEAEMAFKAGADVVVVMGNASDGTIKEAVEASLNYGGKVMVDLLEASATVQRAKEVEGLGAHYIGIHIPIDKQMKGEISFDFLREITSVVNVPVAVAGGINSENVVEAIKAGASILIVGGAITKAEDVKKAIKTIKEAIEKKTGIKTELYKRVSLPDVKDIFLRVSTANISDALHRSGWLKEVFPVWDGMPKMAGRVITVRTYPGDWAKPVEAIDIAEEGDVIVVDAGGVAPAVWGELATNSCITKKVAGVVVYGGVRDVEDIIRTKLPVFTKIICPEAGEPKGLGEINVPIRISGYTVRPGDWVVGDKDGIVLIPSERVVEIANRAMDVLERENRIRKEIKDGGTLSSVMELLKWEKVK
ncbi:MAG: orotidine 5'-phosphate decarboxylase [Candidatus Ratteibacteria bacterium]|nr:orotidine 5'-phosphate decarboxylase [Candidatus Ratteibacteria bacterium]